MAGGRKFLAEALQDFVGALSAGIGESAKYPGARGGRAGMAAALGAPMQFAEMRRQRALEAEDRAMKLEQFQQMIRSGQIQQGAAQFNAVQGTPAQQAIVPNAPYMAPEALQQPGQRLIGQGHAPVDIGGRMVQPQSAQEQTMQLIQRYRAQQQAEQEFAPQVQRNIDPLSPEGIAAAVRRETQTNALKPPTTPRTVTTEEGVFILNPDGTRGKRIGGRPRNPEPPIRLSTVDDEGKPIIRVIPSSEATGKDFPSPPTADMRNKEAAKALVSRSIEAIRALSSKVITKRGIAQRATAAGRSVEAALGNDPEYRTYQDARMALAGNLAVRQQGSRPSDADIKAIWLPLIPNVFSDTDESAAMKWQLIDTMSGTNTGGDAFVKPGGALEKLIAPKRPGG